MNDYSYPREIQIYSEKLTRNDVRTLKQPNGNFIPRRKLKSLLRAPDNSYHEISREYTGVNIRNVAIHDNNSHVPTGGHLRPAISEVEGLNTYAPKGSTNDNSMSHGHTLPISNGYVTRPHYQNSFDGSAPSLSTDSELKDPQNVRATWTTFDQLCYDFDRKTIHKNEARAGKRLGFYRFILDIGRGNFSKVKLAIHNLLQAEVAVKVIDRTKFDEKTRRLLSQELINMERVNHPHIIRVYEVYELVQRWHLVMEYAPTGELNSYLKRNGRLEEKLAKTFATQILSALEHLHNRGVVHRDLKAENVFIVNSTFVKVGDFGFSKSAEPYAHLTTFCGSPPYAAPELFYADSYFGPAVDLWALGVLIFYMVTGYLPFKAENLSKIKRLILSGNYSIPAFVSLQCQTVINGLLTGPVASRFTVADTQHTEWFKNTDWDYLKRYEKASPYQIDDATVRVLLFKWWNVEAWELERALAKGPKDKLTGVYRILCLQGAKYLNDQLPPGSKYLSTHKRARVKKRPTARKQIVTALSQKELTTVDLRDDKTMKGKLDGDGTTARNCNIL